MGGPYNQDYRNLGLYWVPLFWQTTISPLITPIILPYIIPPSRSVDGGNVAPPMVTKVLQFPRVEELKAPEVP